MHGQAPPRGAAFRGGHCLDAGCLGLLALVGKHTGQDLQVGRHHASSRGACFRDSWGRKAKEACKYSTPARSGSNPCPVCPGGQPPPPRLPGVARPRRSSAERWWAGGAQALPCDLVWCVVSIILSDRSAGVRSHACKLVATCLSPSACRSTAHTAPKRTILAMPLACPYELLLRTPA